MTADLNAIAIFMKVIDLKSFRAAALALGIPKSTVSVRVAQLEDQLGTRLLERTTRTLRLTNAGAIYHRQVAPALEALAEAQRALNDLQAQPSGVLRITAPVEFGQNSPQLAAALAEYMQRYPQVELRVELLDRRIDLVEEGFDLAIRGGALPDSSLIARRLGAGSALRLYASPDYLRRCGEPLHPDELPGHECMVMSSQVQPTVWHFRHERKPLTVEVRPRICVNGFMVLRALATAGIGITRLYDYQGASALHAGTLRTVLDEFARPPVPLHAVYPSARNLAPRVRALVELLDAHFSAAP